MNSSTRMTHSPSSSGVSSCYSEMDTDRYEYDGEGSDEEDAFISFTTTESKCEQLYEQGLHYKCMGELEQSLTSFSKCLEGVHSCQYFAKLPQTLHQLADLSRAAQLYEQAEVYSKAESLFYEAVTPASNPQAAKEGGDARQKTKRRPFSKKPKVAKTPANPADYDSILRKKANEFDRLARACAQEGKFDLAMDYSDKAVTINESVLGQKCHSRTHSMDYFRMVYSEARATAGTGVRKGDLSNSSVENGSLQSACIEACLSATSDIRSPHAQEGTIPHAHTKTETHFNHRGNFPDISLESRGSVPTSEGSCQVSLDRRPLSDQCCRGTPTPKQGLPVSHECGNIQRDTRPDMLVNGIDNCWKVEGKGQGGQGGRPLQEINVCVGVTTNITKLKNPMCVNLDLHKGPGEGTEPTKCLPMWILLLPALLALVTYMTLYYH